MIDYLRGRLTAALPGRVILEVGGVGQVSKYRHSRDLSNRGGGLPLHQAGSQGRWLPLVSTARPSATCLTWSGVSGFGPRLALALIGSFTVHRFVPPSWRKYSLALPG